MQTLFFTVKEWNRFSWSMQEIMCKKYYIILTDYKTGKEKIILLLHKINMKNHLYIHNLKGQNINSVLGFMCSVRNAIVARRTRK